MTQLNRSLRGAVLAALLPWLVAGCDSAGSEQKPAPISEETQKKTDEMLKNYGKQYGDMYKAKRAAKR
jgi:hypothetical protein